MEILIIVCAVTAVTCTIFTALTLRRCMRALTVSTQKDGAPEQDASAKKRAELMQKQAEQFEKLMNWTGQNDEER